MFEILPYILCIATVLNAVIFIIFRQLKSKYRTLGFKALSGVFFTLTALFALYQNTDPSKSLYGTFIVASCIFGLLGDVFLALKAISPEHFKKLVGVGMGYFAIGHLFLLFAILAISNLTILPFILSLILALIIYFILSTKKFEQIGSMKLPSTLYYFILSSVLFQSIFTAYAMPQPYVLIFMTGAIFFFISDTLLSFIYYANAKSTKMSILNLSTYYIAQLLISISIMF